MGVVGNERRGLQRGFAARGRRVRQLLAAGLSMLLLTLYAPPDVQAQGAAGAASAAPKRGSGMPLPRFVSLKAGRVNVRVGPGQDYRVSWVFTRSGLPVEIVQEFDNWRRIRDSDGTEGWVFHSLLIGKRTAVVAPWQSGDPLPIRAEPKDTAEITAYLQPKVVAIVSECESGWCRLTDSRFKGWIQQDRLWGVYPDETID
jgi:SH3-like domain-containing protein